MKKSVFKRIISLSLAIVMFALFATNSLAVGNDTAVEDSIAVPIMQAKEGEAIDKYNALLKAWAGGAEVYHDGNIVYPDYYGGAYIDDNKNLVITTTSTDKETLAEFAKIIDNKNVIFQEVEYSYNRLIEERNKIASIMLGEKHSEISSTITGVGVSQKENAVNLYSSIPKDSDISTMNQLRKSVSEFENIVIIAGHGKSEPAAAVLPGSEISCSIGDDRTSGFWARNSSGTLGFVTAPHATMLSNTVVYVNGTVFGQASTAYFNNNIDATFVRRTNVDFTPSRALNYSNITLQAGAWNTLPVGASTASSGMVSRFQTGVVQDDSYTTDYNLTNTMLISAFCQLGDSGGPVASYSYANSYYEIGGMIVAKTPANTQIACKASNIIATLGITIY